MGWIYGPSNTVITSKFQIFCNYNKNTFLGWTERKKHRILYEYLVGWPIHISRVLIRRVGKISKMCYDVDVLAIIQFTPIIWHILDVFLTQGYSFDLFQASIDTIKSKHIISFWELWKHIKILLGGTNMFPILFYILVSTLDTCGYNNETYWPVGEAWWGCVKQDILLRKIHWLFCYIPLCAGIYPWWFLMFFSACDYFPLVGSANHTSFYQSPDPGAVAMSRIYENPNNESTQNYILFYSDIL